VVQLAVAVDHGVVLGEEEVEQDQLVVRAQDRTCCGRPKVIASSMAATNVCVSCKTVSNTTRWLVADKHRRVKRCWLGGVLLTGGRGQQGRGSPWWTVGVVDNRGAVLPGGR
jgi:hypothetical protein